MILPVAFALACFQHNNRIAAVFPTLMASASAVLSILKQPFSTLIILISSLLAEKGSVTFEGANFYLDETYSDLDDPNEKRLAILLSLPINILKLFKDDLFSRHITFIPLCETLQLFRKKKGYRPFRALKSTPAISSKHLW